MAFKTMTNGVLKDIRDVWGDDWRQAEIPAGNDFKLKEAKLTELKAEREAKKEQAQAELGRRQAEALATIHNEIHAMTEADFNAWAAKAKNADAGGGGSGRLASAAPQR